MPIKRCEDSGKPGFKWGDSGKCYIYTPNDKTSMNEAKRRATIQGIATGEYKKDNPTNELIDFVFDLYKEEDKIDGYPAATQNIEINIKNRQIAIDVANYGPINPSIPNQDYWQKKADLFNSTIDDAKSARCANCAAFIQTKEMIDAIAHGLGGEPMSYAIVEVANLGYCDIFEFKCAGLRTCDAWISGGPVKNI